MMKYLQVVCLVTVIHQVTSQRTPEPNKDISCAEQCIKSADIRGPNRTDIFVSSTPSRESLINEFQAMCVDYSNVGLCIRNCTDGKPKSKTVLLLAEILDACSADINREDNEINSILACKRVQEFVGSFELEFVTSNRCMYMMMQKNDYAKQSRSSCAVAAFARSCEYIKCSLNETEQFVVNKCKKNAEAYMSVMTAYQRLILVKQLQECDFARDAGDSLYVQNSLGEVDQSFGCASYCSSMFGLGNPAGSPLRDLFNWTLRADDFDALCFDQSNFTECIESCADGQEKTFAIDSMQPLDEACAEGQKDHIKDALRCIDESADMHVSDQVCRHGFGPGHVVKFAITYRNYETDCGVSAASSTGTSEVCGFASCYIESIDFAFGKNTNVDCTNDDIIAWKKLMLGIFQPAVARRFDQCDIPEKLMPETCKTLLVDWKKKANGAGKLKPATVGLVFMMIGFVKGLL